MALVKQILKDFIRLPFKGRVPRKYFIISLVNDVVLVVLMIVSGYLSAKEELTYFDLIIGLVVLLVVIWCTVFNFSVLVRRLHDIGYSGWYSLLKFIPFVNLFFIVGMIIIPGEKRSNRFGEDPLEESEKILEENRENPS